MKKKKVFLTNHVKMIPNEHFIKPKPIALTKFNKVHDSIIEKIDAIIEMI